MRKAPLIEKSFIFLKFKDAKKVMKWLIDCERRDVNRRIFLLFFLERPSLSILSISRFLSAI